VIFGLPDILAELIISALITLIVTLIYRFLANQGEIKKLSLSMKEMQAKIKEAQKSNPTEANKIANELLALQNKRMAHTMKPMFISSILLIILVLPWMGGLFSHVAFKLPFPWPSFLSWLVPGLFSQWLAWYILASIPFNMMYRRFLGVES
jgi:uncharacterized membrane protein (DUF106 family)